MRKLLLGLVVILLLALSVYTAIYGIKIGTIDINGIPSIKEENSILDQKIDKASKLKTVDYPEKNKSLEETYKKLVTEKENYEQILALGVDENGQPLNKIQEYEIEKIWVSMGKHAEKQGVDLTMQITTNNTISGTYDLNFTVRGGYIQILDFLYDVERDSTLIFKIENFKLVAGSSVDELVGTFVCKDIKINIDAGSVTAENTKPEDDKSNGESKTNENDKTNEENKNSKETKESSSENKQSTNSNDEKSKVETDDNT